MEAILKIIAFGPLVSELKAIAIFTDTAHTHIPYLVDPVYMLQCFIQLFIYKAGYFGRQIWSMFFLSLKNPESTVLYSSHAISFYRKPFYFHLNFSSFRSICRIGSMLTNQMQFVEQTNLNVIHLSLVTLTKVTSAVNSSEQTVY